MRRQEDLQKREREILATLVRQFIETGQPVASKSLAGGMLEPLSSATVRNVMADLETMGYLTHPHTSAGRVPTDRAYRFYVDCVVSSTRLGAEDARYIEAALREDRETPDRLLHRISRVLSEISHNVGLVLAPSLEEKLLEHLKFVLLPDQRVLAVIVLRPDVIENRVIRLEEDISQEDLDRTANFLNAEFRGWSLRTIRLEILKRLDVERHLYDRLLKNVATLFVWGALGSEEPGPLFVDGTAKILEQPEFEDVRALKELLATLEEKAKLVTILTACLESSGPGVRILIGVENTERQMQRCSLVVAPLRYQHRAVGALGVVGPTRMEYDRAITTVDYISHLCSRLLSAN